MPLTGVGREITGGEDTPHETRRAGVAGRPAHFDETQMHGPCGPVGRTNDMSAQQMILAWQEPSLTASQRLVLMDLADCSDREGRNAFRSESSIAEHCQLSIRTVKAAVKTLKERRLLVVQELPTGRKSTTYQLLLGRGAKSAPVSDDRSGANDAPVSGAESAPLTDRSGATRGATRGAKCTFPPTPPYKEDPVDPVDPALARLLSKFGSESLRRSPEAEHTTHLEAMRMAARGRGWPHDPRTLAAALEVALAESIRTRGAA